ncbi:MAG: AAA family ATPase [Candidatus Dormibacteraeota bacterium]|nr:AAA family ATPase [Candidatus Dormibacteraeota bacterium]
MEPLLAEDGPPGPPALLVLVSGAPGSGKTVLAREIAGRLRLFHLHRDSIWEGQRFTAARGTGEGLPHGVEVWYATASLLLRSGVSLVADGTLYRGWDEDNVRPLLHLGEVVNIHCRAQDALERFGARERRQGASDRELAALVARAESQLDRTVEPLDLGCPRYLVDTTAGYDPPLPVLLQTLRSPKG